MNSQEEELFNLLGSLQRSKNNEHQSRAIASIFSNVDAKRLEEIYNKAILSLEDIFMKSLEESLNVTSPHSLIISNVTILKAFLDNTDTLEEQYASAAMAGGLITSLIKLKLGHLDNKVAFINTLIEGATKRKLKEILSYEQ